MMWTKMSTSGAVLNQQTALQARRDALRDKIEATLQGTGLIGESANRYASEARYQDTARMAEREAALGTLGAGVSTFVNQQAADRAAREASHTDFFGSGGGSAVGSLAGLGLGALTTTTGVPGAVFGGLLGGQMGGIADAALARGGTAGGGYSGGYNAMVNPLLMMAMFSEFPGSA